MPLAMKKSIATGYQNIFDILVGNLVYRLKKRIENAEMIYYIIYR